MKIIVLILLLIIAVLLAAVIKTCLKPARQSLWQPKEDLQVAESGATLQLQCVGFSLQWLLLLWSTGPTVVVLGL